MFWLVGGILISLNLVLSLTNVATLGLEEAEESHHQEISYVTHLSPPSPPLNYQRVCSVRHSQCLKGSIRFPQSIWWAQMLVVGGDWHISGETLSHHQNINSIKYTHWLCYSTIMLHYTWYYSCYFLLLRMKTICWGGSEYYILRAGVPGPPSLVPLGLIIVFWLWYIRPGTLLSSRGFPLDSPPTQIDDLFVFVFTNLPPLQCI